MATLQSPSASGDSGQTDTRSPPVFVVHGVPHVSAALAAEGGTGQRVRLLFPFSFASGLGPDVAREMISLARAGLPGPTVDWMIDCDDAAGLAHSALRSGAPTVLVDPQAPALGRLRQIAAALGARIETTPVAAALDLSRVRDPIAEVRNCLARAAARTNTPASAALPTGGTSCI